MAQRILRCACQVHPLNGLWSRVFERIDSSHMRFSHVIWKPSLDKRNYELIVRWSKHIDGAANDPFHRRITALFCDVGFSLQRLFSFSYRLPFIFARWLRSMHNLETTVNDFLASITRRGAEECGRCVELWCGCVLHRPWEDAFVYLLRDYGRQQCPLVIVVHSPNPRCPCDHRLRAFIASFLHSFSNVISEFMYILAII